MTIPQILVYAAIFLIAVMYVRKALLKRSITHYSAAAVAGKLKARENILLLDVRTSGERSRQQIPHSTHIPLHELKGRLDELEKFREKEIVCYCQSGNRSLSAASVLKHHGFRVANLTGGISSWNFGE